MLFEKIPSLSRQPEKMQEAREMGRELISWCNTTIIVGQEIES